MWMTYEGENPLVEYCDEEETNAHYCEFTIDYSNLDGDDLDNFRDEIVMVNFFDSQPKAFFLDNCLITVNGEMFPDEIADLESLLKDYNVDYDFDED